MQRCAMSGFDERPRTDILMPAGQVRYVRDDSRGQFAAAMAATRASTDRAPASEVDNDLTVLAWTSGTRAASSNPNVRDGDHDLRTLRSTSALAP
jgi:hypothetical protein